MIDLLHLKLNLTKINFERLKEKAKQMVSELF